MRVIVNSDDVLEETPRGALISFPPASSRRSRSLRRHHHRQRHLDEFLIPVDCVQGAANIVGYIGRATLLYPKRELHDGRFQGELVFVDLE